jgi:cell division protein FtsB
MYTRQNKDDGFIKTITAYVLYRKKFFMMLFIFTVMVSFVMFGKKGFLQRYELEIENRELKEKLKLEKEKTIYLQKEIQEIKTSDKKVEKIAREKYGMVKEGEEIYRVITDSTK